MAFAIWFASLGLLERLGTLLSYPGRQRRSVGRLMLSYLGGTIELHPCNLSTGPCGAAVGDGVSPMGNYQIVCVNRLHEHRHILSAGIGSAAGWTQQLTVQEVRAAINRGDVFYTVSPST